MQEDALGKKIEDILVVMDDRSWIWNFVKSTLEKLNLSFVRFPSTMPIRQSWQRFQLVKRIIVHWESPSRCGGAFIEEVLDISPEFNISEKLIAVSTNPTHEDVVYLNELGVSKIIRLRARDKDLELSKSDLIEAVKDISEKKALDRKWNHLLHKIDLLLKKKGNFDFDEVEKELEEIKPHIGEDSARILDAKACLESIKEQGDVAIGLWKMALEKNPNYYRAYNNLIKFYQREGDLKAAYSLMKKMHELNKSNISRLVGMGEINVALNDESKAEHYFSSALEKDNYCSRALNGLAEIRFWQGRLDDSRGLLLKSKLAYRMAAKLNKIGIELVKKEKYEEALDHYNKAQYVLPQQEKGPLLFFNIGLCFSRWGKHTQAKEYLQVALIKDPEYEKAKKLLQQIEDKTKIT